jgi:hypothetical protein
MDDITWNNKVKECLMIAKTMNIILDKEMSNEEYDELIKFWSKKQEYEYCNALKKIKETMK